MQCQLLSTVQAEVTVLFAHVACHCSLNVCHSFTDSLLCRTGRLTEEEKARKLAEMQGNAEVHDDARWQRLSDEKKRDAAEKLAMANQDTGSAAAFLKQAHKSLYGATGEAASLEDRVGRRKYYNDKDTERGAFKR